MYTKSVSAIQLAAFWISSGCVVDKTCVEVLFLRLTWIQERLRWWRLRPGRVSTQPFNFRLFVKRNEIQGEEDILITAMMFAYACLVELHCSNDKLNHWTLVHCSSIQVSRNGPFHSHTFHWASLFTCGSLMFRTFTLDSWCFANQIGPFRCVSCSAFIAGTSYTGSKDQRRAYRCHDQ